MVQTKKSRVNNYLIYFLILPAILFGCAKEQKVEQFVSYNGPFVEADNIRTVYSDSTVTRIILRAQKQLELQNGDRVFPKGIWVEFFDEQGKKTATMSANEAIYHKDRNFYNAKGKVVVKNLEEGKQLKTEELNWDPDTKKVYTDKFVTIETGEDMILTGEGLEANQDFSRYKIKKPHGEGELLEDEDDEQ